MERIFEPDAKFEFDRMTFSAPVAMPGGHHFIKVGVAGAPIYIQPPRCSTKQGIAKSGKKLFCDLVFSAEHDAFVRWVEDLETHAQTHIFANRAKWFESDLEMHDIENSMASPLKTYKAGRFYLLRAAIPTRLGACSLKIFDEQEGAVALDDIVDNTSVITILEVRGIRCSARSFQIDIEVRQMMVLNPENMFERCVIHTAARAAAPLLAPPSEEGDGECVPETTVAPPTREASEPAHDEPAHEEIPIQIECAAGAAERAAQEADLDGMLEVELALPAEAETVHLRARTDLYYEMYRSSMKKARAVRNLALSAFMEAKRIKNLYMLDNIKDDGESELDEASFDLEREAELASETGETSAQVQF